MGCRAQIEQLVFKSRLVYPPFFKEKSIMWEYRQGNLLEGSKENFFLVTFIRLLGEAINSERKGASLGSHSSRRLKACPFPRLTTSKAARKWEKSNWCNPFSPPTRVFQTLVSEMRHAPWRLYCALVRPRFKEAKAIGRPTWRPVSSPWTEEELPPLPACCCVCNSFLQQVFIEG